MATSKQPTLADAENAVAETAHRFANTHLPHAERWNLAREHEANLAARDAARKDGDR